MGGILNDKERAYLSYVIKPFRDRVEGIIKFDHSRYEYIGIRYRELNKDKSYIYLPLFEKGTMYKGVEVATNYTLEELGL